MQGLARDFLGFDIKKKTAVIWDDGNTKFHTINIGDIGTAIVNLFSNPEALDKVKNTYVYISSFELTQNKILAELERVTGTTFQVQRVHSQDMKRDALQNLAKGDRNSVGVLLHYLAWGEEGLGHYEGLAVEGNNLLLPSQESFSSTVERVVNGVESFKTTL